MSTIQQNLLNGTYRFTINKNDFRNLVFSNYNYPLKVGFIVKPDFNQGVFGLSFDLLHKDQNLLLNEPVGILSGMNTYKVDPAVTKIDGFDLAMFTKVQFESISLFTSDEIVFSGAEVIYGAALYPRVDPSQAYFTFKMEGVDETKSNNSFISLDQGVMVAGVEIAAPCPPMWRQ
jgi:hypothetical protein